MSWNTARPANPPAPGLTLHHGLAVGADVDCATLQRLSAHGDIADFIWEAPADLTAEHGQLLLAALQAYQAGRRETGERLWQQAHAIWSRAWSADYEALRCCGVNFGTAES